MSSIYYCTQEELTKEKISIVSDLYEKELIYSKKDNKWICTLQKIGDDYCLIERIPYSLESKLNYKTNIYALLENENNFTYKDRHKGVVTKPIKIIDSITIDNVYQELLRLEEQGNIKIYRYPKVPEGYIENNEDLIRTVSNRKEMEKLLLFHPELRIELNNYIIEKQLGNIYTNEDLIRIFEFYLRSYAKKKLREIKYRDENLELIYLQYSNYFITDKRVHNLIEIDYQASTEDNRNRKRYLYRTTHKYKKDEN